MRRTVLALGGLVSLLLLAFPAGSYGGAGGTDTWSGKWERVEIPGSFLFLSQTGSSVSGHYSWNDASGTLSCTVSGKVCSGSFNETHYRGTFTLTLAGKKFSGSYEATNKDSGGQSSGPFNGICRSGACLQNGAGTGGTGKFGVNFSAYAKNVKVLPPLIGAWQLGIAQISGSATITPSVTTGSFTIHFRPLPPKYPNEFHLLYGTLGGGSVERTAGGTKATFTVTAIRSAAPCVKGSTATLTVFHTQNRLSNKQYGDYVTLGGWSSPTCVTWVMGWTNEDGGARTEPSYGGPPSGGQWAHVEIYPLPG